jgi:four helix bundle protein
MKRAAVSIPSNIAEGHGRLNTPEYRHFLGISRGSNFELQTQIEIARKLEIGESKLLD